jgi:phosphopantetheinyl transferase (holo-ACP synthase)
VNISGAARDLADLKGVKQVLLSYSHDEGYAVAQAVLIGGARFSETPGSGRG